ncbi:MAG TPA: hypothetical protein VME41_05160 [Stellaceae bacterium]|nr:hypothetical protein [Stellaceae bacterium]
MMKQMKYGAIAGALLLGLAPMAMAQNAGGNAAGAAGNVNGMHVSAPSRYSRAGEMQHRRADTPAALTQRMARYETRIDRDKSSQPSGRTGEQAAGYGRDNPVGITRDMERYEGQQRGAHNNNGATHRPG